jgi:ribosomal protein S18 acetylase RimI-like enzyme
MANFSIEPAQPDHWKRFRAIRLRSLADSPDAFGTTLAEDEARPLGDWRARLENPEVAQFLAVDAAGNDIGIVVGAPYDGLETATAGLFAMWVAPEARGAGVGGAMVDQVIAWARGAGFERLLLDVADQNAAAIALYESRGFLPNGNADTLPPPRDHVMEHQRELGL